MADLLIAPMETKATGGRRFRGYASTWALDFGGDIIEKGSFARTLERWRSGTTPNPLLDSHNYSSIRNVLGKALEARETDTGVEVEWEIVQSADGDEALARVRGGYVTGLSIGYRVMKWREPTPDEERRGARRIILALEWMETSLVCYPMNDAARVIGGAKVGRPFDVLPDEDPGALEERLRGLQDFHRKLGVDLAEELQLTALRDQLDRIRVRRLRHN